MKTNPSKTTVLEERNSGLLQIARKCVEMIRATMDRERRTIIDLLDTLGATKYSVTRYNVELNKDIKHVEFEPESVNILMARKKYSEAWLDVVVIDGNTIDKYFVNGLAEVMVITFGELN